MFLSAFGFAFGVYICYLINCAGFAICKRFCQWFRLKFSRPAGFQPEAQADAQQSPADEGDIDGCS